MQRAPVWDTLFSGAQNLSKYERDKLWPHIAQFADYSDWSGKRVLDVGCGLGFDTLNFARAGATVFAIDSSSVAVRHVRQSLRDANLNGVVIQMMAENIDFKFKFDLIFCCNLLNHCIDPKQVVARMARHLRPDTGQLKILTYAKPCYRGFLDNLDLELIFCKKFSPSLKEWLQETTNDCDAVPLVSTVLDIVHMDRAFLFTFDTARFCQTGKLVMDNSWRETDICETTRKLGMHYCLTARPWSRKTALTILEC